MLFSSVRSWKGSILLLLPIIAGLLFSGFPVNPAHANGLDPDAVRNFAKGKKLDSLRLAIQGDAVAGEGLPLLLGPNGELNPSVKRNVPLPQNLQAFLNPRNKNARFVAAQLGKALFWDMQLGSDGNACASCHFHAGVDNRVKNQLNPDIKRVENTRADDIEGFHFVPGAPDFELQLFPGHNYTFKAADFPFVKNIGNGDNVLPDPGAPVIEPNVGQGNTNDVASSQGVFFTQFEAVDPYGTVDVYEATIENEFNVFALLSKFFPPSLGTEIRDKGTPVSDDPDTTVDGFQGAGFQVPESEGAFDGKVNVRRVEPRNTPTTINAVFNLHNFWDGRANFHFNGVTPHGRTDRDARIFVSQGNVVQARNIEMKFASLASQAVGPPLSEFEMSFFGRKWPDVGKKMVNRTPLATQQVSTDDSLLGSLVNSSGYGLKKSYRELIQEAFNPNLYGSSDKLIFPNAVVTPLGPDNPLQQLGDPLIVSAKKAAERVAKNQVSASDVYDLMEANFSFFFGVAVMLYEAELVADDTPFDQFMAGDNTKLDNEGLLGLAVFVGFPGVSDGRCINCHGGPEFTNASVRNSQAGKNLIEPMIMGNGKFALYDNGFYNISVTPTAEDLGRGGKGPEDKPLASSRQFLFADQGIDGPINFPIIGAPIQNLKKGGCLESMDSICLKQELLAVDPASGAETVVCVDLNMDGKCGIEDDIKLLRVAVDGAFKTPSIRNQELQGPYFHNGGFKTLLEIVELYDRGGNFCRMNFPDLDPDIEFIGLKPEEERGLVKFIISATDERVRYEKAPFDHPELRIPNGHPGDETGTTGDILFGSKQAEDNVLVIPAVGKLGGLKIQGFQTQLGLDDGVDGHMVAGDVESDVDVDGAPKCNRPPKETP